MSSLNFLMNFLVLTQLMCVFFVYFHVSSLKNQLQSVFCFNLKKHQHVQQTMPSGGQRNHDISIRSKCGHLQVMFI